MDVTGTVGAILKQKGHTIWTISAEAMVFDAIKLMADKNIGAVLVMSEGKLVGILSERDYTRKVFLKGRSSRETPVRDIMSEELIAVSPNHSVTECMRLMTENRIRHLPVIEGEKLIGVVSIGNLVNWIMSAQDATIDQLQNYITGHY